MFGVCSSVACQYTEFFCASAILIGEIGCAADAAAGSGAATLR